MVGTQNAIVFIKQVDKLLLSFVQSVLVKCHGQSFWFTLRHPKIIGTSNLPPRCYFIFISSPHVSSPSCGGGGSEVFMI
jgi:hypothetical protein